VEHEDVLEIINKWIEELKCICGFPVYSENNLVVIGITPRDISSITVRYRYDKRSKFIEFQGFNYDKEGNLYGNPNKKDIICTKAQLIDKLQRITKRAFRKLNDEL
jgi:hypothetical protein